MIPDGIILNRIFVFTDVNTGKMVIRGSQNGILRNGVSVTCNPDIGSVQKGIVGEDIPAGILNKNFTPVTPIRAPWCPVGSIKEIILKSVIG